MKNKRDMKPEVWVLAFRVWGWVVVVRVYGLCCVMGFMFLPSWLPLGWHSIQYTVYIIQYIVCSTQSAVHSIQYTVYSTQYAVHSAQYTVYSPQYAVPPPGHGPPSVDVL